MVVANGYQSNYQLTKLDQENCVNVEAQFQSNNSDELLLYFPLVGIKNFDIYAANAFRMQQTEANIYKIQHAKEDLIKVQYKFCAYNPELNLRHAFVDENSFYFSGAMILPVSYNNVTNKGKIHFSFKNIDPKFK